jgi:hypothetical protein
MESKKELVAIFSDQPVRRVWDEKAEKWWFSVVDIIGVLTDQADYQTARKYWNKLKERLGDEGRMDMCRTKARRMPVAQFPAEPAARPSQKTQKWVFCFAPVKFDEIIL